MSLLAVQARPSGVDTSGGQSSATNSCQGSANRVVAAGIHTVRYAWQQLAVAAFPQGTAVTITVAGAAVVVPIIRHDRTRKMTEPESGVRVGWSLTRSGYTAWVEGALSSVIRGVPTNGLEAVSGLPAGAFAAAEIARRLGVRLDPALARVWRCDLAADVLFESSAEGRELLAGVAKLDLPGHTAHARRESGVVGSVDWRTPRGNAIKLRVYDKLGEQGAPEDATERGRIVRVERQDRRRASKRLSPREYCSTDLGEIFSAPLRSWSKEQIVVADLKEARQAIKRQIGKRVLPGGKILTELHGERLVGALSELTYEGDAAYTSRRAALERRRTLRRLGVAVDTLAERTIDLSGFFGLAASAWPSGPVTASIDAAQAAAVGGRP